MCGDDRDDGRRRRRRQSATATRHARRHMHTRIRSHAPFLTVTPAFLTVTLAFLTVTPAFLPVTLPFLTVTLTFPTSDEHTCTCTVQALEHSSREPRVLARLFVKYRIDFSAATCSIGRG